MNTRFAQWTAPALACLTLIAAACWWDPPPNHEPAHTPTAIVLTNTPVPATPTTRPTATAALSVPATIVPTGETGSWFGRSVAGVHKEDLRAAVDEAIALLTSEQVQAITEEAAAMMCDVAGDVYAPTLTLEDFTEDRRALLDIKSLCASR